MPEAVLADAAGEHDRVGAAELGRVATDVTLDPLDEHVHGEPSPRMTALRRALDRAKVRTQPRHAREPRPAVQ
jgi:hypothetical protein